MTAMAIPPFDANNVLPPHFGDPTNRAEVSPYVCNTLELCRHFATSRERVEILDGFLRLRRDLVANGMTDGFQWLDGSFLEDIEHTAQRPPNDLDAITFYSSSAAVVQAVSANFPIDPVDSKTHYKVDHYFIDLNLAPADLVAFVRYWYGLFSHSRTGVWKGMLEIELHSPACDDQAAMFLANWQPPQVVHP